MTNPSGPGFSGPGDSGPPSGGGPPPAGHYPAAIDPDTDRKIIRRIVDRQHRYANIGMAVAVLLFVAGVAMIFAGVTGGVELKIGSGDNTIELNTAVVGVAVLVIGLATLWLTRPNIVIGRKNKK